MFLYEDHKEVKSFSYAKIKYILVLADVSIFDNNQLQQLELRTIKKDLGEEKNSFWVLRYHIWNKSIIIWYFGEFWIMELHWHKICLGSFITDRVFTVWKSMELLEWITGLQTEYGMYQGPKKKISREQEQILVLATTQLKTWNKKTHMPVQVLPKYLI